MLNNIFEKDLRSQEDQKSRCTSEPSWRTSTWWPLCDSPTFSTSPSCGRSSLTLTTQRAVKKDTKEKKNTKRNNQNQSRIALNGLERQQMRNAKKLWNYWSLVWNHERNEKHLIVLLNQMDSKVAWVQNGWLFTRSKKPLWVSWKWLIHSWERKRRVLGNKREYLGDWRLGKRSWFISAVDSSSKVQI